MTMRCEFDALQIKAEMERFVKIIKDEGITSYLEIGSRCGGSLWPVVNAMPEGSKCMAIDLGGKTKTVMDSKPFLIECVEALRKKGYQASYIFGDSTNATVIGQVYKQAPFDAVFIDGNHTLPYVKQDWANYSPIAKKIVAFHDINWSRPGPQPPTQWPIQVPEFWREVRKDYRFLEIKHDKQDNGIGVLWL